MFSEGSSSLPLIAAGAPCYVYICRYSIYSILRHVASSSKLILIMPDSSRRCGPHCICVLEAIRVTSVASDSSALFRAKTSAPHTDFMNQRCSTYKNWHINQHDETRRWLLNSRVGSNRRWSIVLPAREHTPNWRQNGGSKTNLRHGRVTSI